MGIRPMFTTQDIKQMVDARMKIIEKAIIMRLSRLGEMCVNEARTNGGYTDRTGNLRSSVGYVIMANGKEVSSKFVLTKDGQQGIKQGSSLALQISSKFATGYAIIVVAGMDYAYYVEATGLNVLDSAEALCKKQLPVMMKQLRENIKNS